MAKDMEAYGGVDGPAYYWVATDEDGFQTVLEHSGFQTIKEVVHETHMPVTEDNIIEIRFGYSYQMSPHADVRFCYTHDEAQEKMEEEFLQDAQDYKDGAYDRWADDRALEREGNID